MKNKLLLKIFSRLITFFLIVNLILSNFLAYPVFAQEVSFDPSSATQSEEAQQEAQQASVPAENNPAPAISDVSSSPSLAPDSNPESTPAPATQENLQESANTETSPSPSPTSVPAEETAPQEPIIQEPTPTIPEPTAAPEIPEINETLSSENVSLDTTVDLSPSPIALPSANSLWSALDEKSWTTTENVELNKEYVAPQNDKVKTVFTKLPETSGKLTIKEVKLTNEQMEKTGALSDTAYDITSTMEDGTFEYDLILPIPADAKDKDIEIKSAENLDELNNAQKVEESKEKSEDTVIIKGLNHLTVFVVANAVASSSALVPEGKIFYFRNQPAQLAQSHILSATVPNNPNSQVTSVSSTDFESFRHFHPGIVNFQHISPLEPAHTPVSDSASWISDEPLNGSFQAGGWRFVVHKSDDTGGEFSKPHFNVYSSPSNTDLSNAVFLFHAVGPDWWNNNDEQITFTSPQIGPFQFNNEFLVAQLLDHCIADCNGGKTLIVFEDGLTAASQTRIEPPLFTPAAAPDTISPVITLLGENPVNLTVGDVYTDAGATALDDVDGDITANIATTGLPVDTSIAGQFTITYNVTDAAGNSTNATRTVNVVEPTVFDTTAPVIAILGTNPTSVVEGTLYTDAGATALDDVDGDLTAGIVTTGLPVDTSVVGEHIVTYSVSDTAGNTASAERTVNVAAAPVSTPPSEPPASSEPSTKAVNAAKHTNGFPLWYQDDKGVRVAACLDGSDPICVLPGEGEEPNFDPTKETEFTDNFPSEFFYYIAESDIISTPNGGKVFMRFAVEGAFLNDDPKEEDQMVFGRIRATGTGLESNSTYTFTHPYGVDTFLTDETGTLRRNTSTEDIGCEISPCNFQEALDSRVFGGFLSFTQGAPAGYLGDAVTPHEVTGSPTGNNFVRVEGPGLGSGLETDLFTVSGKLAIVDPPPPSTEEDITAPVITILGANPVNVNVGEVYNDAGATALDNIDGDLTASIATTGLPVDTSSSGQFTVTYTVTDQAGNTASANRTVSVAAAPLANGSIAIIENAIPNDPQDFGFRLRNNAMDERFSLDDDADISNDLSNTKTFSNLVPGDYSLEQNSASNWVLDISCEDQDNGTTVDVNAGKASIDLDSAENIICTFVNSLKRSITGNIFNDLNINGAKDGGEIGLSGWMIFLDANDNGILDSGEASALTDANGNYQFLNVSGGTHNVVEVLQADWEQTAPVGGKHTVIVNSNNSLINQDFGNIRFYAVGSFGRFVSASGANLTTSVISRGISTINILANGGISSIIIPDGTVISRVDGGSFNLDELLASVPSSNILLGLEANVIDGVLQWGIPNVELQFSTPITLSIFVGNSLNNQTLNIKRSVTGTSNWTTDGIAVSTCIVADGLCTFQATKASFYIAMHSNPAPITSSSSETTSGATTSTGGSSSNNAVSAPVCNDTKPGSAPTLLSVIASGLGQATLTWSKALDPVTYYLIGYGTTPGQFGFGTPNIGGKDTTNYTVSGLSDATNYYFRVRAGNGCMPGEFSNEMAIRPLDAIFATANTVSDVAENNLGTGDQDQDKTEVLGAAQQKTQTQAGITNTNFITSNPVIVAIILLILSFLTLSAGSFYKKLRRN